MFYLNTVIRRHSPIAVDIRGCVAGLIRKLYNTEQAEHSALARSVSGNILSIVESARSGEEKGKEKQQNPVSHYLNEIR